LTLDRPCCDWNFRFVVIPLQPSPVGETDEELKDGHSWYLVFDHKGTISDYSAGRRLDRKAKLTLLSTFRCVILGDSEYSRRIYLYSSSAHLNAISNSSIAFAKFEPPTPNSFGACFFSIIGPFGCRSLPSNQRNSTSAYSNRTTDLVVSFQRFPERRVLSIQLFPQIQIFRLMHLLLFVLLHR